MAGPRRELSEWSLKTLALHRILNQRVLGSSPGASTILSKTWRPGQPAIPTTSDPFAALAEYASNAAAIKADLTTLLDAPAAAPGTVTPGESAFRALAELASKVADNWGFVAIPPAGEGGGDGLVPTEAYTLELQTRARLAGDGTQLLDALVLIRAPGTASWGPGRQIPTLGYLDAHGQL